MNHQQIEAMLGEYKIEDYACGKYSASAVTHKGCVRNHNEDAYVVLPEQRIWAVADGMGGHEAGDVASQLLTDMLSNCLPDLAWSASIDHVEDIIAMAHTKIREYSDKECSGKMVGTTLVTLVGNHEDTRGAVLWAGDSRLYCFRDHKLQAITRDHSQHNEMVDRGLWTQAQADALGDGNVITRAIGASQEVYMDCSLVDFLPGDIFLLCSDGLYGALPSTQIQHLLAHTTTMNAAAEALMNAALSAGARDNVTVVLIEF